ncbi:MAG: alpha/beta hydrolase [Deltaproteobacteria bacterium]|nr:alpha/beta hydrolase [Deltaproteobacteria bacterium]
MGIQNEINLSAFCAPGAEALVQVTDQVSLRVITFTPAKETTHPQVVFVAGLISQIMGWEKVLLEMTRDFKVYYVETREKASSVVKGNAKYSIEEIGKDIVSLISRLGLEPQKYILFGSSLGATAILDSCRFIKKDPLCLVLIGPNAIFRFPKWSFPIIWILPPRLYLLIKPLIRWYLRNFEVDIKSDYAQYEKYSNILDIADPWKLKKIVFPLARYSVWDRLNEIHCPALIIGASKDIMHIPENILKMVKQLDRATYLDMQTNSQTHSEGMVHEMRKYIISLKQGKV